MCQKSDTPLAFTISSTTLFPFTSSMSTTAPLAPSRANNLAVASPMPLAPPVTIATLPLTLSTDCLLIKDSTIFQFDDSIDCLEVWYNIYFNNLVKLPSPHSLRSVQAPPSPSHER